MTNKIKARILRYKILGIRYIYIVNSEKIQYYEAMYKANFSCLTYAVNSPSGTVIDEGPGIRFTND